jgi:hypothetical protein
MSRDHVSVAEENANEVLACCIFPQSDVKVQVLGKMQRAIFRPCDLPTEPKPEAHAFKT